MQKENVVPVDEQLNISTNLSTIENNICVLANEKKQWVHIYLLLDHVEKNELFKPAYPSFTQWIYHMADISNCTARSLWSKRKAGQFYVKYRNQSLEKGKNVPTLEECPVSAQKMLLVEKIVSGNTDAAEELMGKVLDNEVSHEDLTATWNYVKSGKQSMGLSPVRKTYRDTDNNSSYAPSLINEAVNKADCLTALSKSKLWTGSVSMDGNKDFTPDAYEQKYKIMTNFSIRLDHGYISNDKNSDSVKVLDFLALESLHVKFGEGMKLHGLISCLSKQDKKKIQGIDLFGDHVDYLWVVAPRSMVDEARENISPDCGVLVMENRNIYVMQQAHALKPKYRSSTLARACYEMI